MPHKRIILVTLFFLFPSSAYPKPSLLWKKSFDGRIIKTSKLKKFSKGLSFPLRAVLSEKSIYIFDNKGKTEKKISLKDYSKATISDDASTIAGMKGKEINVLTFRGKILSNIKIMGTVVLPQHISFELSPNGEKLVLISSFSNTLYFYSKTGKLLSEYNLKDSRGAKVKFSKDGQYVAVHVPNWGTGKTTGYILFFDSNGKELWRFNHKGCQANFDISEKGRLVLLIENNLIYALNQKGKLLYKKELHSWGANAVLSGEYIAMTTESDTTVSLLRDYKTVWSQNIVGFKPRQSTFTSAALSKSGNNLVIGIKNNWQEKNKESSVFLFDKSGNTLWQHRFYFESAKCSFAHNSMLIKGNNKAFLYILSKI